MATMAYILVMPIFLVIVQGMDHTSVWYKDMVKVTKSLCKG